MNGKPIEKTRSERHAAANEPPRGPKRSEPPRGPKRSSFNWKSLLGVAVALFLAWQVIHVVSQSTSSKNASGSRSPAASSSVPTPVATPTPTVTLGGHRVAATAGPAIVLNPGLVAPGGPVTVDGSGFTPRTSVVVWLRAGRSSKGTVVAHGKAAGDGTFIANFNMPASGTGNGGAVVAQDTSDGKTATADLVTSGGVATAKIVGKAAG